MKKIIAIFYLILVFTPYLALAQTNPCSIAAIPSSGNRAVALPKCINQVYVWSLGISALLAILMVVLGGYYYMTSAGNAENATKGVEMIWSAVIGLALLFGAYLLLNTINPDLVKFNTDSFNGLDCSASPSGATGCTTAPPPTTNVRQ